MQKQAPSIGKIGVAVGFALSCFALLLFLWITFGGAIPFKPESYRFSADFPEAITLSKEADVRLGGVSVGKVKSLELSDEEDATRAVIEIDPRYAPISSDARAILRQKTLLGETYVELTSGTQVDPQESSELEESEDETAQTGTTDTDVGELSGDDAVEPIEEGGHLEDTQVQEQVQIDEIFQALDKETRQSFQLWMKNAGIAIDGRGLDLNDAFGNLGPFSEDATDVLGTLRRQEQALRDVVRNTGTVFEALTAREQELAGAVVGSNRTFRALASRDESLAETFQILPTFEEETRLTLNRVATFADDTEPLVRDLRPVADDLSPTFQSIRRLSPHLRNLFVDLRPLLDASLKPGTDPLRGGLPALRRTLARLRPVLSSLDPFLANLNPVIRYLEFYKAQAGDFLAGSGHAFGAKLADIPGYPPRHALRVITVINAETLAVFRGRPAANRGNAYLAPDAINNPDAVSHGALPSFDCDNAGGEQAAIVNPYSGFGGNGQAACFVQPDFPAEWGGGRAPQVFADP